MGQPSQSACPVLWVGKVTAGDRHEDLFDIEPELSHRQPRSSFFVDSSHALRASMHANQSIPSAFQQLPMNTSTRADNPLSNGPVVVVLTADEERQHTQKMLRVLTLP